MDLATLGRSLWTDAHGYTPSNPSGLNEGRRVCRAGAPTDVSRGAACNLVLMETGHHEPEEISRYLKQSGKDFGKLALLHAGKAVLRDPEGQLRKARDIMGDKVFIPDDVDSLDL